MNQVEIYYDVVEIGFMAIVGLADRVACLFVKQTFGLNILYFQRKWIRQDEDAT